MRVLAITNMYPSLANPTSGVFVQEQVRGLQAIGLEVRVLFIDRRQVGPQAYWRAGTRAAQAAAGFAPDIVHLMYGGVMAYQVVRQRRLGPVVVTFHGSDLLGENLSGLRRKWLSRLGVCCSRWAAARAQGVVVVARHLVRALGSAVPENKLRVIPCGIDLERFRPMDPLSCRQQLGWSLDAFHVLFATSNGDPVKRPWLAQAAVTEMAKRHPRVELHQLTGVENAQVPVWLNASDALLLTSLHEGSPTIVKEALGCGLPVVSVEVGDVAERIEGIEGCHLALAEPAALADKLCLVQRRGRRLDCRKRLEALSIISVARQLKQFYVESKASRKECK